MSIDINSQFSIPRHPDVPADVHNKMVEHQVSAQLAQVKQLQKLAARRRKIIESFDGKLKELLGSDRFKLYSAYVAEQQQLVTKGLAPAGDPISFREQRAKLEVEFGDSNKEYLSKLGIDGEKVQALVDRTLGELRDGDDVMPKRDGEPVTVVPLAQVPEAILKRKTNPWTVFEPPFPGWSWYYTWNLRGYEFNPTLYLDAGTGLIGNGNFVSARNDIDVFARTEYNTAVSFLS